MLSFSKNSAWSAAVLGLSVYFLFDNEYEKNPIVRTSNGNIEGFVSWSRGGRKYYQFLGIPYAKPPVEALRFEPPQPIGAWNETLSALSFGPSCIGFDFLFSGRKQGVEDCLFLNVMTPNTIKGAKRRYPVIVYIHGGSFVSGSARKYPGKYFMDEDIVLVTIQYRLGIFGFLSTKDGAIKGNMGLKDQVMALKWVQSNIENFGGDPNQVTVMGESAGGTSVHYLMLSPLAKGLFRRAVSMSCDSSLEVFQPNTYNITKQLESLRDYFKCPLQDTKKFAECMRSLPVKELSSFIIEKSDLRYFGHVAEFGPVPEIKAPGAFITESPLSLLTKRQIANRVPWMTGFNDNEGILIVGKLLQFASARNILKDDKMWADLLPNLIFYDPNISPDAARAIKHHFFGNETLKLDDPRVIANLSALITEKLFIKSLTESVELQGKLMPIYMYVFTHRSFLSSFNLLRWASLDSVIPSELLVLYNLVQDVVNKLVFPFGTQRHYGASHGEELFLLFDMSPITNFFTYFWEYRMSKLMVKTIADFAHVRKPVKFNNLTWPDVVPSQPLRLMNLKTGQPELLTDPYKKRLRFWKELNLPRT